MRTRPSARPYLWALGVLWLLPAVGVWVGYLTLPDEPPRGQCEGIGFGCVPAPNDALVILGMVAMPFLLVARILAIGVIAYVGRRRDRRSGSRRPD